MTNKELERQGSLKIVDTAKIMKYGALFVASARLRTLSKWMISVMAASFANPLFYLLSIGVGIGSFVNAHSTNHTIDGVPYLTFLAPALLAMVAIQDGLSEVTLPTLQGFLWEKNFFAMNATPITGKQIALGTFLAAVTRTFFSVLVYFIVIVAFGAVDSGRSWIAIITAMFASSVFAALMMGITAWAKNSDLLLTFVGRFIVMPLFLFSGTFYPLSSMPIFLQWLGWISPLWHSIELGRYFTYGHHLSGTALALHFGYLLAMLVFGLLFSFNEFEKRLSK